MKAEQLKEYNERKKQYMRVCQKVEQLFATYAKSAKKLLEKSGKLTAKQIEDRLAPMQNDVKEFSATLSNSFEDICALFGVIVKFEKDKLSNKQSPEFKLYESICIKHLDITYSNNCLAKSKLGFEAIEKQLVAVIATKQNAKELS